MNLSAIAGNAVSAVNPFVEASYRASTGYTTSASGSRTPAFAAPVTVGVQVQALTFRDLQMTEGLNLTGERRALYVNAAWKGVSRPDMRGGDIVTLPDSSVWLVNQILEDWTQTGGWVKAAITRQMAAP